MFTDGKSISHPSQWISMPHRSKLSELSKLSLSLGTSVCHMFRFGFQMLTDMYIGIVCVTYALVLRNGEYEEMTELC